MEHAAYFVGGFFLGVVFCVVVYILVDRFLEKRYDGTIGINDDKIDMRLKIPFEDLVTRRDVNLKVKIYDESFAEILKPTMKKKSRRKK